MPRRPDLSDIEVALIGSGVSLETTSIWKLAELLRVVGEMISDVAAELSIPPPSTSLVRLKNSSAGYQFHSTDKHWRPTARRISRAVRERGRHEGPRIRSHLRALYSLGGKDGRVRVTPVDKTGKTRGRELLVEAPASAETPVAFTTSLYGRVVGLLERGDGGLVVHLDRDDGGRVSLAADETLFEKAVSLVRKPVRVSAVGTWDPDLHEESDWRLHSLDPWHETDVVQALEGVRADLEAAGVSINIADALRELEDDS